MFTKLHAQHLRQVIVLFLSLTALLTITGTVFAAPPSSPATVSAAPTALTTMRVSWTDVAGETGYNVYKFSSTELGYADWPWIGAPAANVNYYDVNVKCGHIYSFAVTAKNADGESAKKYVHNIASASCSVPPAPQNFKAEVLSVSQIKISWGSVSGATHYQLQVSPDGQNWTKLNIVTSNITNILHPGLACGTTRYYKVLAHNYVGDGPYTSPINATTFACPQPPAVPTNVKATGINATEVNVTWNDVQNETGYKIEYLAGVTWKVAGQVRANVTSFKHTGLYCNGTYEYRVSAVNNYGTSSPSLVAGTMTKDCPQAPATPTNVKATGINATEVNVTWNDVQNETGYKIEYLKGVKWEVAGQVGANVTSFKHTGLYCNGTYEYRVSASNNVGTSAPSLVAGTTTKDCQVDLENELVNNGSFEMNNVTPELPDFWKGFGPLKGDKIVQTGSKEFQFTGKPNDKSRIEQVIYPQQLTLNAGDTLELSAAINQKTGKPDATVVTAIISYSDGTTQKINLKLAQQAAASWKSFSKNIALKSSSVSKITVQVKYGEESGKFLIDNVSLKFFEGQSDLQGSADAGQTQLIELPAAPADLRGN